MVNKACFRKSVIRDFVSILAIIVGLVVIGIVDLMLNALTPILAPFGTAFNCLIISYSVLLFLFCFFPFLGKPSDLKEFPTICLIIVGYIFGFLPFICYLTSSSFHGRDFPDIIPLTVGWMILMLICIPISMGYARCRGE